MQGFLDYLHTFWFLEVRGAPLWGWLLFLAVVTMAILGIFVGSESNRCTSNGDCWPEF